MSTSLYIEILNTVLKFMYENIGIFLPCFLFTYLGLGLICGIASNFCRKSIFINFPQHIWYFFVTTTTIFIIFVGMMYVYDFLVINKISFEYVINICYLARTKLYNEFIIILFFVCAFIAIYITYKFRSTTWWVNVAIWFGVFIGSLIFAELIYLDVTFFIISYPLFLIFTCVRLILVFVNGVIETLTSNYLIYSISSVPLACLFFSFLAYWVGHTIFDYLITLIDTKREFKRQLVSFSTNVATISQGQTSTNSLNQHAANNATTAKESEQINQEEDEITAYRRKYSITANASSKLRFANVNSNISVSEEVDDEFIDLP